MKATRGPDFSELSGNFRPRRWLAREHWSTADLSAVPLSLLMVVDGWLACRGGRRRGSRRNILQRPEAQAAACALYGMPASVMPQ